MVVRRYCIEIHGDCDRLCLQTQLADAEQRICDLEAELAHSKLEISMQSHTTPTGPCSKCRSMEATYKEVLSQVSIRDGFKSAWKFPGDYHNVRSSAFANLCAGSPSKVGCFVMLCYLLTFGGCFFSFATFICEWLPDWPILVFTVQYWSDCMAYHWVGKGTWCFCTMYPAKLYQLYEATEHGHCPFFV